MHRLESNQQSDRLGGRGLPIQSMSSPESIRAYRTAAPSARLSALPRRNADRPRARPAVCLLLTFVRDSVPVRWCICCAALGGGSTRNEYSQCYSLCRHCSSRSRTAAVHRCGTASAGKCTLRRRSTLRSRRSRGLPTACTSPSGCSKASASATAPAGHTPRYCSHRAYRVRVLPSAGCSLRADPTD